MKKLIALLVSFAIILSLTSCRYTAPRDNKDNTPKENDLVNINAGIFWYDYADIFNAMLRDTLSTELDTLGITYTNYDAQNQQTLQNEQIDTAIYLGANLLIINIVDTASINDAQFLVDKAKEANIPVIFFDREVDDEVIKSYENSCFVGVRYEEAGELQGQMAGQYIIENYDAIDLNGDGKISYIMMKGELGNQAAEARSQYSIEFANAILEEAGKPVLEYYDSNNTDKFQATDWMNDKAFDEMEAALITNTMDGENPIEVVFANNDDMAIGCIEALNNVGWNTGEGNSIPVFGIDCTAEAADAIEADKMTGSILMSVNGIAETITVLTENLANGMHVFENAEDMFNVDNNTAKIRVPYEIVMKGTNNYPDYSAYQDFHEYDDLNVSVFWYNFRDAFLTTIRNSLDAELSSLGINYENYDAQIDQATQNDQIDTAIAQGTDLLIINIVETADINAAQAIVDMAKAANIPVIFFNREVDDNVINSYDNACFVGVRAEEAGEKQGIMAGNYIVDNFEAIDLNGDGKISYIMMKGQLGNPEAEARTQYSIEFANDILNEAGKPSLEYYDPYNANNFQVTDWMKDRAFNAMSTALGTNPMDGDAPVEVVFANNDDAALGSIEALNNAEWNTGSGKSIPIFGVDYISEAADAIEAGRMTGSILHSAMGIAETIAVLVSNVVDGEHVFANAENMFNVDENSAKIRVPYEIMM